MGLGEAPNSVSKALTKVNSLGSNSGPLIALLSPYAHFETGPRMCPPEKPGQPLRSMPRSPFSAVRFVWE
jgi:hypothetical protein